MNNPSRTYLGPRITIFVKHSQGCAYKGDEQYKRCNCWKHLRWFIKGKKQERTSNSRTWEGAERAKREKEIALDPGHAPTVVPRQTTSIKHYIEQTYITAKISENIGPATIRKLRAQLGSFEEFMAKRNKFSASQITKEDLIAFRATWKWAGTTKQKGQQNLRGFLRAYVPDAQQLKELLDVLKPIKLTTEDHARLEPRPYSEEEITELVAQIPLSFEKEPEKIMKLTALVRLQVATGLAAVDAVRLERISIEDGWLRLRRKKTGRPVRQRLDESILKELQAVANSNPRYIFWNGTTLSESATGLYQEDLRTLMKAAGLYIKGNLSHRFRDTAVDFWLGQGWTLTDVADALGDTVAVVERHYKSLASKRAEERIAKLPVRGFYTPHSS